MKRFVFALSAWTLLLPLAGLAQEPVGNAAPAAASQSDWADAITSPTEEMWFYIQEMRRYDDPQQAVRRNAEYRAAQRRTRIATMKWLGYSKSRPMVSATPFTGQYGVQWVHYPTITAYPTRTELYQWVGGGTAKTVTDNAPATSIHIQDATIRR